MAEAKRKRDNQVARAERELRKAEKAAAEAGKKARRAAGRSVTTTD